MVRTKIVIPPDEIPYRDKKTGRMVKIEYGFSAYYEYDADLKKDLIIFELSTVKMFSNFKYTITHKVEKIGRVFKINILGLSAPDISFPFTGKAIAKIQSENLSGLYEIHIIKQEGYTNAFKLDINSIEKLITLKKELVIDKKKDKKFCLYLEN